MNCKSVHVHRSNPAFFIFFWILRARVLSFYSKYEFYHSFSFFFFIIAVDYIVHKRMFFSLGMITDTDRSEVQGHGEAPACWRGVPWSPMQRQRIVRATLGAKLPRISRWHLSTPREPLGGHWWTLPEGESTKLERNLNCRPRYPSLGIRQ